MINMTKLYKCLPKYQHQRDYADKTERIFETIAKLGRSIFHDIN